MISYDIDGVLATIPPSRNKPIMEQTDIEKKQYTDSTIKWYKTAKPLLQPKEPFIAITARNDKPYIRKITENWLDKYHKNNLRGVYMLDTAKTYDDVARFKAKIINKYKITRHTEDNLTILRKLKDLVGDTELYHWQEGMKSPELF